MADNNQPTPGQQDIVKVLDKIKKEMMERELQSLTNLVCRLLLEKKKQQRVGVLLWQSTEHTVAPPMTATSRV